MKDYKVTYFSQIDPEPVSWEWEDRIARRKISLMVGNGGVGKTLLTMYIAAQISKGAMWPDRPGLQEEEGKVIILTTEDDLADTVRVRLGAADANMYNICTVSITKTYKDTTDEYPIYDLLSELDILEQMISDTGDVSLLILDPITAYMGKLNGNSNTDVRHFCSPLKALAEKYDLAVLGISHFNKNEEASAANRILGSVAWNNAARSVWGVFEDPADPEEGRLFLPIKWNISKNTKGLKFRLVSTEVETERGPIESVRCEFERDEIYKTAEEVFKDEKKKQRAPVKQKVKKWIEEEIKKGNTDAKKIEEQAAKEGISRGTLYRAKEEMGVKSKREGKKWVWMLAKKEV